MSRQLQRLADIMGRNPWWVLLPQLMLVALGIGYSLTHLRFSGARADLVSDQVKYQSDFIRFKREFQLPDALVAVVESESLEKNRRFVERLASRLHQEPELFANTYYKGDLRTMGRKALLFLSEETLEELRKVLHEKWPFIEAFSKADTLNALFAMVNRQFRERARDGELQFREEDAREALPVLQVLRRVLNEASRAVTQPLPHSFPGLIALFGDQARLYLTFAEGRMYAVVTHAASPEVEQQAVYRLRQLVRETGDEIAGVNAGISGEPVLNHDEMVQALRDISLATIISMVLVAVIFSFGFHAVARPLFATLGLLVGIAYALGFATLTVGRLNILSITLVPILIGLAIDFGVHLVSRFEEELSRGSTRGSALRKALALTGVGIFTSGFTTAGSFFAMLLTDFKGIQEMGFVSGAGLLLCLVPMVTLLPALLVRGKPDLRAERQRLRREECPRDRISRLLLRHPGAVVVCAALLTLLSITQFPRLDFDYNLLNLQSSDLPAVGIEEKLIRTGSESLLYGVVLADSLEEAVELERRIEQLEPVSKVTSMVDPLTEDQSRKLELIREIKRMAGSLDLPPPNSDPVNATELDRTLFALQGYLGLALEELAKRRAPEAVVTEVGLMREGVARLRSALSSASRETVARLADFQSSLFGNLRETIQIIRDQDDRERLRIEDLPPFLRERFISPSGKFLLQVHSKADLWQRPNQEKFITVLRSIDPDVTGTLVQIYEVTLLIKENFLRATAYAAGIIALILLLEFRRLSSVLLAVLPVLLGLCWMLGLMGLLGMDFNPVNIMALTLLIGIGVPNGIHILNRFSEDVRPTILACSTGRAVLISALTTIAGFGSLIIAKHQGIQSLGEVMALGTGTCLIAALTVLPALLALLNRRKQPGGLQTPVSQATETVD